MKVWLAGEREDEAESQYVEADWMMTLNGSDQIPLPQPVLGPLTRAAIFLVVTVKPEPENYATVRSFCSDLSGLIRAVEFRDIDAGLTCIASFGSDATRIL